MKQAGDIGWPAERKKERMGYIFNKIKENRRNRKHAVLKKKGSKQQKDRAEKIWV